MKGDEELVNQENNAPKNLDSLVFPNSEDYENTSSEEIPSMVGFEENSQLIIPGEQTEGLQVSDDDKKLASDLFYSDEWYDPDDNDNDYNSVILDTEDNLSYESMEEYAAENNTPDFSVNSSKSVQTVMVAILCVFVVSLFVFFGKLRDYKSADELYRALKSSMKNTVYNQTYDVLHFSPPSVNDSPSQKLVFNLAHTEDYKQAVQRELEDKYNSALPVLASLYGLNNDLMGWINIKGIGIDYPFVHGIDNKYYLKHAFNKSRLSSGTIFADWRNDKSVANNRNLVLYGHKMTNGTMFGKLSEFLDESFFYKTKITIISLNGIYEYTPFSVFATDSKDLYFETVFENDAEYESFLKKYKEKSEIPSDIALTKDSKILTLSTCSKLLNKGRLVVMSYLSAKHE